jgi:uncharacterized membrane protein YjjP (DUF1212 family)
MSKDKDLLLSDLNHYRAYKRVLGSTLLSAIIALVIAMGSNSIGIEFILLALGLLIAYALSYRILDNRENKVIEELNEL